MAPASLVAALVASSCALSASAAMIHKLECSQGSVAGGTYVRLSGVGLSDIARDDTTKVFFGSNEGKVIWYDSSDSQIMVYTPANPDALRDNYAAVDVRVAQFVLNPTNMFAACVSPEACRFTYSMYLTPRVSWSSAGATAGDTVRLVGDNFGSSRDAITVRVGDYICNADESLNPSVLSTSVLHCYAPAMEAGVYNLTLNAQNEATGLGNALLGRRTRKVDPASDTLYHFVMHPKVTGLSTSATGMGGGSILTIRGSGFSWDNTKNEVMIGDTPCRVVSSSPTEIQCRPDRPQSATPWVESVNNATGRARLNAGSFFSTGAGLLHRVLNGPYINQQSVPALDPVRGFAAVADMSTVTERAAVDGLSNFMQLDGTRYANEFVGFFVPPITGDYSFYVRGDDHILLSISSDESPANLALVSSMATYSTSWYGLPTQISSPKGFTGGRKYYFRLQHYQGVGSDGFEVAMRMHATTSSDPKAAAYLTEKHQNFTSLPDIQSIRIRTDVVRERQELVLTGVASGNFLLLANGQSSAANMYGRDLVGLPWNAAESSMAWAVNKATGCPYVTAARTAVTGPDGAPGYKWVISFHAPTRTVWPTLSISSLSLAPVDGKSIQMSQARLNMASVPASGTWRASFDGSEPSDVMQWNTGAWKIQELLRKIPALSQVEVAESTTNADDGATWDVTFWGVVGDAPLLTVIGSDDTVSLQGSNVGISAVEQVKGSLDPFFWPLSSEFFETAGPAPAVVVKTNGIKSVCDSHLFNITSGVNPCLFRFNPALTPYITSINATTVTAGDMLEIIGTNFLPTTAGYNAGPNGVDIPAWELNKVYIGESGCNVTRATATRLVCRILDNAAGVYDVSVEVAQNRGFALYNGAGQAPQVTYPVTLFSVSPLSGSMGGGQVITLTGTGFPKTGANTITIDGRPCTMLAKGDADGAPWAVGSNFASFTRAVCRAPAVDSAYVNDQSRAATIVANGVTFGSSYVYSRSQTPQLLSLTPATLSSAISGIITLSVSGVAASTNVTVRFGDRPCRMQSIAQGSPATLTCILLRGPALPLPQNPVAPSVYVDNAGYATGAGVLDTSYRVDSMSSSVGSLEGGTEVVFTGVGFHTRPESFSANEVIFVHRDGYQMEWRTPCKVLSVSPDGTVMTAVAPKLAMIKRTRQLPDDPLSGRFVVKVNNITAPCASSLNNCSYTQNMQNTPVVTSISTSGNTLTLTGSKLNPTNARVLVGLYTCASPTGSATSVQCTLPIGTAGASNIGYVDSLLGNGRVNANYTFPLSASIGSSLTGSIGGGMPVTITGAGFVAGAEASTRNVVFFGNSRAQVLEATTSQIKVLSPAQDTLSAASSVSLRVMVLDKDALGSLAPAFAITDTFTYDPAISPRISSVSPTTGFSGASLVITGSNLAGATKVAIGGAECAITASTATSITCTAGPVPAGTHRVLVSGPVGFAAPTTSRSYVLFTGLSEITEMTPAVSSIAGGQLVTIKGRGFGATPGQEIVPGKFSTPSGDSTTAVNMCNSACVVVTSSYDTITCKTKPVVTQASLATLASMYQPGPLFGTVNSVTAHDLSVSTPSRGVCSVEFDMGFDTQALVTEIAYYPQFRKSALLARGRFEGTNNRNGAWDLLSQVGPYVQEGWTRVPVYGDRPIPYGTASTYRYLRFVFDTTKIMPVNCIVNEIEFRGFPVAAQADGRCKANVTVTGPQAPTMFYGSVAPSVTTTSSVVAFTAANTPVVTGVSPDFGSALGGTPVTITGRGFVEGSTVVLNGVPCTVMVTTGTSISCTTGPRDQIRMLSVQVTVPGFGAALYDSGLVYFRYLDRWSALTTWKYQEPPVAGDSVIVPKGQSVLVDVSTPILNLVMVQGELIFDRKDLTFDAHYIFVHGGRFEAGSERNPFLNNLTITLHGDRYTSIEIPEVGTKMLAVMGMAGMAGTERDFNETLYHHTTPAPREPSTGVLEMHGKPRRRVWTKLATTAYAGSSILTLTEDVDWVAGDRLFVTRGKQHYDTEEVTVALALTPKIIMLTAPLRNDHESTIQNYAQYNVENPDPGTAFGDIHLSSEVGLLSRNVVIQGDEGSTKQLFGVHTGVFHGGVYHMENVEIRRCGQAGGLGRYCTHSHMLGDSDNYVRFNSIHHSFQRGTTIHATNHLQVKHNVYYRALGHTVFVEDGVEKYNEIEENLVVLTEPLYMGISSDVKPANFWTASPTNFWRHNVAAGSTHFGFWFELPSNPEGPSFTPTYCPVNAPLGEFFNNTAHSNGMGLRVYPQYRPMAQMCNESVSDPQYFRSNRFFWNTEGAFHRQVGDVHHVGNAYLENSVGHSWRRFEGAVDAFKDWNLRDCLFVCEINGQPNSCSRRGILAPQTEYFSGAGLTFVNYWKSPVLEGCNACNQDGHLAQGGYTTRWARLRFENSMVRVTNPYPSKEIFHDLDGTLTGYELGTAIHYWKFNEHPECTRDTEGTYSYGLVCDASVRVRRIQIDGSEPRELDWMNMNISSSAGSSVVQFRPKELYGWVYPAVVSLTADRPAYFMNQFISPGLVDWRKFRVRYSEPDYMLPNEWVGLNWTWIDQRYRNKVVHEGSNKERPYKLPEYTDPAPTDDFGTGNLPMNNTWTIILNPNNATGSKGSALAATVWNIQCPPGGCQLPDVMNVGEAVYWSQVTSWPNGRLPVAGENVIINSTTYMILDIDPPKLGKLTINGRLEFENKAGKDRKLRAESIIVWGELLVGSKEEPYIPKAEIILYGNRYSPATIVDNNLFLGNKMMAVLGKFEAYGKTRDVAHAKLASTATKGSKTLYMTKNVADIWMPGERVVIASTEWDHNQFEERTIDTVNGNQVTLTQALDYNHYSGPAAATGAAASLFLRASVGLLSRNVVVRADLVEDSSTSVYGGSMVVSVIRRRMDDGSEITKEGKVNFNFVEFRAFGKQSTDHPAILFQYGDFLYDTRVFADNAKNFINGCAFSSTLNGAVQVWAANHVSMRNNVFYGAFRSSIEIDKNSKNATLVDNLVIGSQLSPDLDVTAQNLYVWSHPQAGIYIDGSPGLMSGNIVASAWDAGFTFRALPCSVSASRIFDNEVHGSRIGVYLMPSSTPGCIAVDKFTVWKNAHHGILAVDSRSSQLHVRDSVMSDNHIGLSLNFLHGSAGERRAELIRSVVIGTSAASADCSQSTICRAMHKSDPNGEGCNSVIGSSFRRVGILTPMITNKGKTCETTDEPMDVCRPPNLPERMCALPWEKRFGTAGSAVAGFYVTDTKFINFPVDDCQGKSRMVVWNPSQTDLTIPISFRGVSFEGVAKEARFYFWDNEYTHAECSNGQGCDGVMNILVQDLDGSLTGPGKGSVIGLNPTIAFNEDVCSSRSAWGGFECPSKQFRFGVLLSTNAGRQRLGPLRITRMTVPSDETTWQTTLSFGPLKEPCSIKMYWPQHPHLVVPGYNHHFYFPATEPAQLTYHFLSPVETDTFVGSIHIQRPYTWEFYVDSVKMPMLDLPTFDSPIRPLASDPLGTWLYRPEDKRISFTVKGGKPGRRYDFVRTAAIQMRMHLSVSQEYFFGEDNAISQPHDLITNLALLLNINPWQIKVVDVAPGDFRRLEFLEESGRRLAGTTSMLSVQITDSQPTVLVQNNSVLAGTNSTTPDEMAAIEQAQRLVSIATNIELMRQTGELAKSVAAYGLLSVAVDVPPLPALELLDSSLNVDGGMQPAVVDNSDKATKRNLSVGAVAGIVVGTILAAALLLSSAVLIRRNASRSTPMKSTEGKRVGGVVGNGIAYVGPVTEPLPGHIGSQRNISTSGTRTSYNPKSVAH